jgi:hypothetical protein
MKGFMKSVCGLKIFHRLYTFLFMHMKETQRFSLDVKIFIFMYAQVIKSSHIK